jgi:hypothetical protein
MSNSLWGYMVTCQILVRDTWVTCQILVRDTWVTCQNSSYRSHVKYVGAVTCQIKKKLKSFFRFGPDDSVKSDTP